MDMEMLESRMLKHFDFEEAALSPILGDLLMNTLLLAHRRIAEQIRAIREDCLTIELGPLSQEDRFMKKSELARVISSTARMVQDHAADEEVVLKLAEEALIGAQRSPAASA